MDSPIIATIIGAIATITASGIGAWASSQKEKTNAELKKQLARYSSGQKPLKHYLLFWSRNEHDWAEEDWKSAQKYISKFQPTCGFSRYEAANAEKVTIVGAPSGVDDGAEKFLTNAGCKIERLDGSTGENTAELLNRRVRANRAFEGGQHRQGY